MNASEYQDAKAVITPLRQVAVLAVVGGALWVLLAGPAWLLAEWEGLTGLTVSAGICLFTGIPVQIIAGQFSDARSMVPMMGSMVRLVFVFCGCLMVVELMPTWGFREFFIWLVVYYFVLLAVETAFIVRNLRLNAGEDRPDTSVSA